MKKKILSFAVAMALTLTAAICLAACERKDTKYYYTISLPEHCEINFSGQGGDDQGFYVLDGESLEFYILVEEGYQSTDFKVTDGSAEIAPIKIDKYEGTDYIVQYTYYYTPKAVFEIKATGTFTKIVKEFTMSKTEEYIDDDENNTNRELFIRFKQNSYGLPTTETVYADFVNGYLNNFHKDLAFGDTIGFDVYYKGTEFMGNPNIEFSYICKRELYYEENEIGYHYTYTQRLEEVTLFFGNFIKSKDINIKTSEAHYLIGDIESDKLDITRQENGKEVTITLKNHTEIDKTILDNLKLVINGENQNIDFSDSSSNGVFTITLKNPWEYSSEYRDRTDYDFDLNFYEFDYFGGVINF